MGGGGKYPQDRRTIKTEQADGQSNELYRYPPAAALSSRQAAVSHPAIIRKSGPALQQLADLKFEDILVLFTPVVPPPPGATRYPMDPFEPLGRALSEKHSRIRHVPYVPAVGFTDTHMQFAKLAHAVMVVTCAPAGAPSSAAPSARRWDILPQFRFARSVAQVLRQAHPGARRAVPTVLLLAGQGLGDSPWDCGDLINDFDITAAVTSYERDALARVPDLLFGCK